MNLHILHASVLFLHALRKRNCEVLQDRRPFVVVLNRSSCNSGKTAFSCGQLALVCPFVTHARVALLLSVLSPLPLTDTHSPHLSSAPQHYLLHSVAVPRPATVRKLRRRRRRPPLRPHWLTRPLALSVRLSVCHFCLQNPRDHRARRRRRPNAKIHTSSSSSSSPAPRAARSPRRRPPSPSVHSS